ncbi:predicted protein, partial [Nematostella vectensis]
TATQAEIRRAYRRISLQLHPDRNKEDDAELKFRKLVAVAEVLKDEDKRKRYDTILRDGMPDWRQPVYYYRRVRKMGLVEFVILLFFILTIGHYIVAWSIYLEKKFELEVLSSKMKKEEKKRRKAKSGINEEDITEIADVLVQETGVSKPSFYDLLPFQVYQKDFGLKNSLRERLRNKRYWRESNTWTEEDTSLLSRAMAKFPGGTPKRWEKISQELGKSLEMVTKQVKKIKQGYTVPGTANATSQGSDEATTWSQAQQKLLEIALQQFPKTTPDRWTCIARAVPGMTKEDCINRYKYLVELVRNKKTASSTS